MSIIFRYRLIMFPAVSLLTTLLLALSIAASPVEIHDSPITLSIARSLNTSGGTINLLQHDQSRAAALKAVGKDTLGRRTGSIPVTNVAVCYIASVGIGNPATTCGFNNQKTCGCSYVIADNLIVDNSCSVTWVDATTYVKTSTSVDTGKALAVSSGSVPFSGMIYNDIIS
jgi:hypothetical protein